MLMGKVLAIFMEIVIPNNGGVFPDQYFLD
jgi:hypothetical protein